jgi:hypothetical protein
MKYALVIGNNKYNDPKLAQLQTPQADAQALARVLKSKRIGGFDEVVLLNNQTDAQIRRAISAFLANKKPDDLVLLYFSGHGVLDGRGNLFLALKNTDVSALNATAISSSFLSYEMDNCRSRRQILILDCCHSGAFARGAKAGVQKAVTESTFEGSGSGRVVLTASDATQFAFEGDQVIPQAETKYSVFTHFLLEGLKTGKADRNRDGKISLDEWYDYCYASVTAETPGQVPHKWSYHQQGEIIIAQNPFPPQPTEPSDLRAMLDQKQLEFQQHSLLLDSDELKVIANELKRKKLELLETDKRLILLSAAVHDEGRNWLGICGKPALDWLREAYRNRKLPLRAHLGAVRLLGQEEDEQTFTDLLNMVGRNSSPDELEMGLNFLAHFIHRSPAAPALTWKLRRLLFPRMIRIASDETAPMRARLNRGIIFLVPICFAMLFGALAVTDSGLDLWSDLPTWLIFSASGIVLGLAFAWVTATLAVMRGILPEPVMKMTALFIGSLVGTVLFTFLTGFEDVWIVSAAGGVLVAGTHLLSLWKRHRAWAYLSLPVAVITAALVYGFSASAELAGKIGETLSATLFAGGYTYLAAKISEVRNAHN